MDSAPGTDAARGVSDPRWTDAARGVITPVPGSVPPALLWGYRVLFVAVVAIYITIVYAAVRALQGNFGASPLFVLLAVGPAIIMGVFLLPLVPLSELPENWVQQQLPAARLRRGCCPSCGYRINPATRREGARWRCPECGGEERVPPLVEPSWSALRRFLQMAVVGYLAGIIVGEALVQIDEWRFRAEVRTIRSRAPTTGPDGGLSVPALARARQWPGSFATLHWSAEGGFESEAPGLGSARLRSRRDSAPPGATISVP
ncbi:MAG: hypothetical protein KF724_00985 [Phycisphaeraceae bacterium]|nr:hypothetical protein [Phycisphaeraceae bacterium]